MIDTTGLLMIEPKHHGSSLPVLDALTRKMTAAWRTSKAGVSYRGVHVCVCGATSDNCEHHVPINGRAMRTNSLAVHYLAFHRSEVPESDLRHVGALVEEAAPTAEELKAPKRVLGQREGPS